MKFGKEFESQMVPEWHATYMNYNFLKSIIKDIQTFKIENIPNLDLDHDHDHENHLIPVTHKMSLYRTLSGLTSFPRYQHSHHHHPDHDSSNHLHATLVPPDPENPPPPTPIVVKTVEIPTKMEHKYETQFLMDGEQGGEYELIFFKRLDDEFNKVDKFYRSKVEEMMNEAEELNKQMNELIAFRITVDKPHQELVEMQNKQHDLNIIEEGPSKHGTPSEESSLGDEEAETINSIPMRQASLELGENVSLENKKNTILRFLTLPKNSEVKFSKNNLRKAEKKLQHAFVEFYHKLRLLESYSFLNHLAFSKIMRKYDKVTARSASKSYLEMVQVSYIGSNVDIERLVERVEATFIKHFTNSSRSKGMSILRHKKRTERHSISILIGFLAGVTAALVVALILMIRACRVPEENGAEKYMQTIFPLYSFFLFVVLHIIIYALNIFFWRKYNVNYSFILGFKPGTELGYREVFLMAFGLSALSVACVLSNLDMKMDPDTHGAKALIELLPLAVLLFVIAVLFCPFNVYYRSSRYFFLKSLFHDLLAPFYHVTLQDFFVADQLTSQAQAFRSIEFYICYYGWRGYKTRENTCMTNEIYKTFYYIAGFYPFFIRFLQCVRRLVEEKDLIHFYNALKCLSTVVAVIVRTAYGLNKKPEWMIAAWVTSVISGIAVTYWDIVYDWGLLNRKSKNPWLRDKLMVPYKSVYFAAIVENAILRFAWFKTVLDINISSSQNESLIAVFAILEILRRGVWNFFRLENDHLYNVGKYKALKSVPMPINYNENEDSKDE